VITSSDKIRLIKTVFGGGSLDVRSANIAVECPACGKAGKRKLSIHLETGRCHCWVCGLRAKRVSSVIYRHISREVAAEYRKKCEDGDHIEIDEDEEEKQPDLSLPDDFHPVFSRAVASDPDARQAARYLLRRGLSVDDIVRFRLGISPAARRRVIVPSFDAVGKVNFYTARSIDPDVTLRYTNCQVKKTDVVFNELNIDWSDELTLVEGPFDLMKCPDNSTCLLGSNLGLSHILFQKIVAHRTPIVLALDADMCHKAQKIAELLHSYDCSVRLLEVSCDKDVGDMSHGDVLAAIKSAPIWRPMDRLIFTISNIRSGSRL
jgi:DNA primase